MKTMFEIFNAFIILYFITLAKGEICGEGMISISGLGKCKSIVDILQNKDLTLKKQNLLYLASNDEGKIEKDGYKLEIYKLNDEKLQSHNMRKSKLYIPNSCLEQMEKPEHFDLDRNKAIVIMVYDANNLNDNNITDNYFIILHIGSDGTTKYITSKTDDFSFCNQDPILFEDEVNIKYLRYNYTDTTPIDIDKILYGRKFGIDLFDPYSDFLNNICFKFTSEKGSDVTLDSRLEDYYQNISFCDDRESSHYLAYNYSAEKGTFTYRCAFGFYKSEEDKSNYLDIIDKELKSLVSVSNLKVIKCYKKFLNLKDIITNFGGMICILVLLIQIVCFLLFCFLGIKTIELKVDDLIYLKKALLRRLSNWTGFNFGLGQGENQQPLNKGGKKFNLWGQIKKLRERRLLLEKNRGKKSNPPPKNGKRRGSKKKSSREKKDYEDENEQENQINIEDVKNEDINYDSHEGITYNINNEPEKELNDKKKKDKKKNKNKKDKKKKKESEDSQKEVSDTEKKLISDDKKKSDSEKKSSDKNKSQDNTKDKTKTSELIGNSNQKNNSNNEINFKKSKDTNSQDEILTVTIKTDQKPENNEKPEIVSKTEEEKKQEAEKKYKEKEKKKAKIDEYGDDEMNELPFSDFLEYDDRSFCRYYLSVLMISHIILNVFFRHKDFNLFTVKLGLLFMTFPINLTFNIFFFTNKNIKLSYVKNLDDISMFWENIANTIYASILSNSLLIILKFICLTHNSVRELRKKDLEYAQNTSGCLLRWIKVRISIYYVLSFAFLIVFGFYVLCFCSVFENTQIELIKSTFTSWLISILYPFILCFFTSVIRSAAIKWKSRCLYAIKLILQFL